MDLNLLAMFSLVTLLGLLLGVAGFIAGTRVARTPTKPSKDEDAFTVICKECDREFLLTRYWPAEARFVRIPCRFCPFCGVRVQDK